VSIYRDSGSKVIEFSGSAS